MVELYEGGVGYNEESGEELEPFRAVMVWVPDESVIWNRH